MSSLPTPNVQAQMHSQLLAAKIQQKIQQNQGWLSFADFMQSVLYTPGLGYYSGGAKKFGLGGDFVTAPEISSLFGRSLSNQVTQVLSVTGGALLELGAGTGKLAIDLLAALQSLNQLPERYYILEVSAYLRQIQSDNIKQHLPQALMHKVVWLDRLPAEFTGVIVANEVLDAIPVHLIHHTSSAIYERGVAYEGDFIWQDKVLSSGDLYQAVLELNLPDEYLTELCPAAAGLVKSLAQSLTSGAMFLVDYGFSAREYYHPQRNLGTLMCHYQHYGHTNPLIHVGLQDVTAHVDFSAIGHAGIAAGLDFAGFTTQAQFLMNCGILQLLTEVSAEDTPHYAPLVAAVQKLLSPAEMGDLFKVIAFVKAFDTPLLGFAQGDKSHTL